jgi:hypothetical protein
MGHDKYDLPVLWGRGPLPAPVPFWFRIGEPIHVTCSAGDEVGMRAVHRDVWGRAQAMLDGLVDEWRTARGAEVAKEEALRCA